MCQDKTKLLNTLTRDDILAEARTWLGVPFKHQGRTHRGVDCVNLLKQVCVGLGVDDPTPDIIDYPRRPSEFMSFIKYLDDNLIKIKNRELKVGRVVAFKDARFPYHCGILGMREGEFTVIHAAMRHKRVVEELYIQQGWDKKLIGVYEFPSIDVDLN